MGALIRCPFSVTAYGDCFREKINLQFCFADSGIRYLVDEKSSMYWVSAIGDWLGLQAHWHRFFSLTREEMRQMAALDRHEKHDWYWFLTRAQFEKENLCAKLIPILLGNF